MPEKLTNHFTRRELACRCCGEMGFTDRFLTRLEELRVAYGKPMIITSGYRCPAHNALSSHTGPEGPHTKGAVDVSVHGPDAYALVHVAMLLGFSGIGIHQTGPHSARFIHIDDINDQGIRPRVWSY